MATNAAKIRNMYFRTRQFMTITRVPEELNRLMTEATNAVIGGDTEYLDRLARQIGAYAFFMLDYVKDVKAKEQVKKGLSK